MDWYPWHYIIYERNTMHLNPYQDGCYRRLIDHYMKTRSPLPDNDAVLARIVGDNLENWLALARDVIRPFFVLDGQFLTHTFCDHILNEQDMRSKERSKSATKAAKARWVKTKQKQGDICEPHADVMRDACETDARPMRNDAIGQDKTGQDIITVSKDTVCPFALFNELAVNIGLPVAQKITKARKSKMSLRLKDVGGIDGWKVVLGKIENSPFLRGENKSGWKADIDFILQESSIVKIMEGKYDGTKKPISSPRDELADFLATRRH